MEKLKNYKLFSAVHVLLSISYSDFILILSNFYPNFIQVFFETHFIQILF